ncbi:MAG: 50S ribosomal protein L25/general stress protein Ctc [Bacteroidetes bacterium]|nr:50S ribosomal protein L25/general stress protein Ctc [Bacteroidota bacterium]
MKTVSMSGSLRENVGKKDAKKNRAEGKVPCVLYGGKDEVHFSVTEKDFGPVIFTPYAHLINLTIAGKEYQTILQDVQYHPVTDKILHVDFLEVLPGKPVVISIPIRIEGVSEGVLRGGKLVKKFRKLKVKALPKDLPDEIKINISPLDINDIVKVSDIVLDNVILLDAPSSLVLTVLPTRAVEAEVPGKK